MCSDDDSAIPEFAWISALPADQWQEAGDGSWILEIPRKDLLARAGIADDVGLVEHFQSWAQKQHVPYTLTWLHRNPPYAKVFIVRSEAAQSAPSPKRDDKGRYRVN